MLNPENATPFGSCQSLSEYLASLMSQEVVPLNCPDHPPWFIPGENCEVEANIFRASQESASGRWMMFAFDETGSPKRLFWLDGDRFCGRELTDSESLRFRELSESHA